MHVYYFFMIPIKDEKVQIIDDLSLRYVNVNKRYSCLIDGCDDSVKYLLLKGIEESSCHVDNLGVETILKKRQEREWSDENMLFSLLQTFTFPSVSFDKYLSIAQYPLLVLHTKDKRYTVFYPKTATDVFNHCFLHYLQFLKVKQLLEEERKLQSLIKLLIPSNSKYIPAIQKCSKYVTCCLNNIVVEVNSGKIYLLKHECHRTICPDGKVDNSLLNSVKEILG